MFYDGSFLFTATAFRSKVFSGSLSHTNTSPTYNAICNNSIQMLCCSIFILKCFLRMSTLWKCFNGKNFQRNFLDLQYIGDICIVHNATYYFTWKIFLAWCRSTFLFGPFWSLSALFWFTAAAILLAVSVLWLHILFLVANVPVLFVRDYVVCSCGTSERLTMKIQISLCSLLM